jgi:hypothetical protein
MALFSPCIQITSAAQLVKRQTLQLTCVADIFSIGAVKWNMEELRVYYSKVLPSSHNVLLTKHFLCALSHESNIFASFSLSWETTNKLKMKKQIARLR